MGNPSSPIEDVASRLEWARTWVPEEYWGKAFGEWPGEMFKKFMSGPSNLDRALEELLNAE